MLNSNNAEQFYIESIISNHSTFDSFFGVPFHVPIHGRFSREAHLADVADVRTLAFNMASLIGALTSRLRQMLLLMSCKFHIVGELSLAVGIFAHIAPSMH